MIMCKLCEIQKWSHRVSTMLPWLVIPLIGLWALSQILPPTFRFEITSSRLACVFVLLVTLFWYEILMPQLSAWRVRRNARLRERERLEAIEYDKLRKTAVRRCRNCLTPYRDQNPGGGRFMCSYCGHISKRPVLDLPALSGFHLSNSGIIKDLVAKGGKASSGKVWSENRWMYGQDWLENGNRINGPFKCYWRKNSGGFLTVDNQCWAEKSCSSVVIFACKMLNSFFLSMRWLWRMIFRVSTSGDDASLDAERRGMLAKRADIGANFHETRGEKARRKAEEKRQARLEKELLEEEERKQREEVARLVEERRRLRDERVGSDKDRGKGSAPVKEKDGKKDVEKKRQERRKEKEKVSCKSNSDAEELEKRSGNENEKKHDFDKKGEIDRREHKKSGMESVKIHGMEISHGKGNTTNNFNRGNTGTRYLDRMRGTFLSPSKAFSGGSFFGKGSTNAGGGGVTVSKENKFNGSADHIQSSGNRRDSCAPEHLAGKFAMNGDEKSIHHHVLPESQPMAAPKKSWQQLFTRSSAVPPSTNVNVISRPNVKGQADGQHSHLANQSPVSQSFDNPINFGLPSPFTLPSFPSGSASSAAFPSTTRSIFPRGREAPCNFSPDEPDIFEDPCYVPDPVSLLGPVSESLDNFQLDLGTGFATDIGTQLPHGLKNVAASSEVNRPSPIESPMSKSRISDERHASSKRFQSTPKAQDVHSYSTDDSCDGNDKGTWQMWNTSPLGQDGLGLVSGTTSWLLPPELNRSNKEDVVQPSSHRTMGSLFTKEDQVLSGTHSPHKVFISSGQSSAAFSPVSGSGDHDPWLQSSIFQSLSSSENHLSLNPQEETGQNEVIYRSPRAALIDHHFEASPANCWSKKERGGQGSSGEGAGNTSVARSPIYTTPDVQSLWSYE